ncbi:MAG: LacI family DNA-binding transcriptional regulator [Lacisediminihabitans sp.]
MSPVSAIADVARLAGVSKSTASRALSGHGYVSAQTRARVEDAAAQIGYVVSSNASSLVTGHTRNVGVVIPYITRWFFSQVLEGIQSSLIAAGYDLTLYRLSEDETQRRRIFDYFLVRKRVDAVIAVGIELSPQEVTMLHSLGKPIVGIGGEVEGISTISIDDVETARRATEHLLSLGHTRIVHLGGDPDEQMDFRVHSQRLTGVTQAMDAAGVTDGMHFQPAPFSIPGGYATGLSLLADPRSRPTAIVAGCDEIAIGVIIAARQLGIQIPSQLSVIGIDGHDLAEMFALTTLEQFPSRQGIRAVELVMERMLDAADSPARAITMPVHLTVRRSTTAPPKPSAG